MRGWWRISEFRGGVLAVGVLSAEAAAFLVVMSIVTGAAWPSWPVLLFAPPGFAALMFAVLVAWLRPWRYVDDIVAMLAGDAWVHWTYSESSWRAAHRYDGRKLTLWFRGLLVALGVAVTLMVIGIAQGRDGIPVIAYGGFLIVLVSLLLPLVVSSPAYLAGRAKLGEIYVSGRGIYRRPGGYLPLDHRHTLRYESVELVDLPTPHIHIVVKVPSGDAGWVSRTLTDVGVPDGREDEARALVERLRTEVVDGVRPAPPPRPPVFDQGW